MKKLCLMRHAKSSWEYPEIADHDRPLNEKGISDAYKISKYLLSLDFNPDLIICSPSVRTYSTAKILIETLKCGYQKLSFNTEIYESNAHKISIAINNTNSNISSLLLIGHEPSLTDFCAQFLQINLLKIPTSGFVFIDVESNSWNNINHNNSKFLGLTKVSDLK